MEHSKYFQQAIDEMMSSFPPEFREKSRFGKGIEEEKTGERQSTSIRVEILGEPPFRYGEWLKIRIVSTNMIGKSVVVSLWDNDRIFGIGTDTELWKKSITIQQNMFVIDVQLSLPMRRKAHVDLEFWKAEYYVKVYSGDVGSFYSSEFTVIDEDVQVLNQKMPNYFGKHILRPDGSWERTHEDAICILNEESQVVGYLLPDDKLFIWVSNDGKQDKQIPKNAGYFEGGIFDKRLSYSSYVEDKYNRRASPISWGLYLAVYDFGDFGVNMFTKPNETMGGLLLTFRKIVTLDFDLEKTWERILNADTSDASYVVSSLLLGYLAGPKGKGLIKAEEVPKFATVAEEVMMARMYGMSFKELLKLWKLALKFESEISATLSTIYTQSRNYVVIDGVYLRVKCVDRAGNTFYVTTIADNLIFNTVTETFYLNETKYGISNILRRAQRFGHEAIMRGDELEVRSFNKSGVTPLLTHGQKIKISKIIRSHSVDGTISAQTIREIWP